METFFELKLKKEILILTYKPLISLLSFRTGNNHRKSKKEIS